MTARPKLLDRWMGRLALVLIFPAAFSLGVLIVFLNEDLTFRGTCRRVWRDYVNAFREGY